MKNGLAIWQYPHRTDLENVAFFAEHGFASVSVLGSQMDRMCSDEQQAEQLSHLIRDKGIILTVHHQMPRNHSEECVLEFKSTIDKFAAWQNKYRCLSVLSFDVLPNIRDNITPYVDYVLNTVPLSKIALEDFGLTDAEKTQIEHLKSNKRFGYLIDIGHLFIRICGKNNSLNPLFTNSPDECPVKEQPTCEDFLSALLSKEFPIYEIHLHNNNGVEDLHYFLDDGNLDMKIIANVLKHIGFDGVLTIESAPGFFQCAYPESDRRILESYELWKNLIGES